MRWILTRYKIINVLQKIVIDTLWYVLLYIYAHTQNIAHLKNIQ